VFAVWLGDAIDGVVGVLFSAMGAWWLASTRRDASSGDLLAEAVFVAGALLLVTLVQRLRAARRVAEEAIRTRDLVLAAVSHDVQTPLTAVLGWAV
jgi:K+-sensing histidine kinase KdpD